MVQVFEDGKDAVVYVTGPILSEGQSSLQEFFRLPGKPLEHISIGSGFVIHPAGYVLTNAHATEKVIAHNVSLSDGKTYPADLIATVHDQDVAAAEDRRRAAAEGRAAGTGRRPDGRRDGGRDRQPARTAAHLHGRRGRAPWAGPPTSPTPSSC